MMHGNMNINLCLLFVSKGVFPLVVSECQEIYRKSFFEIVALLGRFEEYAGSYVRLWTNSGSDLGESSSLRRL